MEMLKRGDFMLERTKRPFPEDLRLHPDLRLCPKFDALSIALYPVAEWEDIDPRTEMGFRVVDNCAEEHMM